MHSTQSWIGCRICPEELSQLAAGLWTAPRWVIMTARGSPVEPEVSWRKATSSAPMVGWLEARVGSAARSSSGVMTPRGRAVESAGCGLIAERRAGDDVTGADGAHDLIDLAELGLGGGESAGAGARDRQGAAKEQTHPRLQPLPGGRKGDHHRFAGADAQRVETGSRRGREFE